MDFSASFDANSLASVKRLSEFDALLEPALETATSLSLDGIEAAAQTYMWGTFINPTGQLENAFEKTVEGTTGILSNTEPYAHRRNDGFSGQTDSLGRFYPYDPGIHYMEFALQISEPFVETTFAIEAETALALLGGE